MNRRLNEAAGNIPPIASTQQAGFNPASTAPYTLEIKTSLNPQKGDETPRTTRDAANEKYQNPRPHYLQLYQTRAVRKPHLELGVKYESAAQRQARCSILKIPENKLDPPSYSRHHVVDIGLLSLKVYAQRGVGASWPRGTVQPFETKR